MKQYILKNVKCSYLLHLSCSKFQLLTVLNALEIIKITEVCFIGQSFKSIFETNLGKQEMWVFNTKFTSQFY